MARRSKALFRKAAEVRGLTVSDSVRSRIVPLDRESQIALWRALQNPPAPTRAQRSLGKLIKSVR